MQESGCRCSVHRTVVEGKGNAHSTVHLDLAVLSRAHTPLRRTYADNSRLWRIDHGGKAGDIVVSKIRHGNGTALELIRFDSILSAGGGQCFRFP